MRAIGWAWKLNNTFFHTIPNGDGLTYKCESFYSVELSSSKYLPLPTSKYPQLPSSTPPRLSSQTILQIFFPPCLSTRTEHPSLHPQQHCRVTRQPKHLSRMKLTPALPRVKKRQPASRNLAVRDLLNPLPRRKPRPKSLPVPALPLRARVSSPFCTRIGAGEARRALISPRQR